MKLSTVILSISVTLVGVVPAAAANQSVGSMIYVNTNKEKVKAYYRERLERQKHGYAMERAERKFYYDTQLEDQRARNRAVLEETKSYYRRVEKHYESIYGRKRK